MSDSQKLYDQLKKLETEQRNPETLHIDLADPGEIVRLMNEQDKKVAEYVSARKDQIAMAVDFAHKALAKGGRLIYTGAGTSGRLGVLDAAECPPTFGTHPDQVIGLIAGGREAMFVAQEGSEDLPEHGERDIAELNVSDKDVVCGLAASGRTPYVLGTLDEAKRRGARTVMVCCVVADRVKLEKEPDVMIDVPVGPEVIMGSTRLKSATAQKMVCNMISTGAMIRLGKVYENVMVDLMLTNKKLVERSRRIISMFTDAGYEESSRLLKESGGKVKIALLMGLAKVSREEAEKKLEDHNGFIRAALQSYEKD
ncbi:N-acetylmuramic acid 6-phosphate etherase [Natronogracilivirga saccharolytica]|uniref:N-acetylmuramic acid 6-phosphate etherase n=1 Tax=Natronogracilivirga saccharolytica TaxID=2812953 RepID=UPI001FE8C4FD|nr:N-acetylmuramic acid 6-phosphate etherase [Natronogracilivirga saccharolytica]